MIKYQDIINQLIESGLNPNDFNIVILEDRYKVEPKVGYEFRKIVQEEMKQVEQRQQIIQQALDDLLLGGMQ